MFYAEERCPQEPALDLLRKLEQHHLFADWPAGGVAACSDRGPVATIDSFTAHVTPFPLGGGSGLTQDMDMDMDKDMSHRTGQDMGQSGWVGLGKMPNPGVTK